MTISADYIAKARKHLGYTAASPASGYGMGYPVLTAPQFLFEQSIQNIIPANEAQVIRLIDHLECLESKAMEASLGGAPAERAEDVTINLNEGDWFEKELVRWTLKLAELLGCPVSPWAERFKQSKATGNIRVR